MSRPVSRDLRERVEPPDRLIGIKADAFYARRREQIEALAAGITRARRQALPREALEDLAQRIEARSERIRHELGDYRRGIERHERQTRGHVARRLGDDRERVSSAETEVGRAARRRVEAERQQVRHQGDLIQARDFRQRGWVLAGRADGGTPVSSFAGLGVGDRLLLRAHDSAATTTIDEITVDQEGEHDE